MSCQGCAYRGQSTAVEDTFFGVRVGEKTNLVLCVTSGKLFAKGAEVIVDAQTGPAFGQFGRPGRQAVRQ